MTRVLLYLRQSITEAIDDDGTPDSLSLSAQERVLRELAERQNWQVIEPPIVDPDLRGWDDQRPGLLEIPRRVEADGAQHVLVYDLSRFARSVRIQENTLYALEQHGAGIVSYREPEASNPLFRQILGAIAEQQTRTISGYVRAAMTQRARRGLTTGSVPFGYRLPARNMPLEPDPETAPIVQEIFSRFGDGESAASIAADLTRRGIPTPRRADAWWPHVVRHILRNPVYRGDAHINGELIRNAHPALIDAATWERVRRLQTQRHRPRAPRAKRITSWLEGLVIHGCGAPMYLIPRRNPRESVFRCDTQARQRDQRCPALPRSRTATALESEVLDRLTADLDRMRDWRDVADRITRDAPQTSALEKRRRQEANARINRAERRRRNAEELYLSGARDRAWFDAQDGQAAAEIAAAEADLASLPTTPDRHELVAIERVLRRLRDDVPFTTGEQWRPILQELGHVVAGDGGAVQIVYRAPYARFLAP